MADAKLAIVFTGGGARAAYQVGFLRYLSREFPELRIPILTGVSAGAINASHIASHTGGFKAAIDDLVELWLSLTIEQVFRVDALAIAAHVGGWGLRLVSGGSTLGPKPRAMVDTRPLRTFLEAALPRRDQYLVGVERNIERGSLEAFAITTTSYASGRSITWVQGHELELWERPQRSAVASALTLDHIMASAALPLLFPAVCIGDEWHGDGGIRLTSPLSPAIHMGADRIIAVSPRYLRPDGTPTRSRLHGYPPPAHIAGLLMNAVFLDMLDADAMHLRRINDLIAGLPASRQTSLRPIDVLLLRPSRDLGRLASAHERTLPALFRFFMRGLGTGELRSADYLSLILFEPRYLENLIELGEQDAAERKGEIHEFLEGAG